MPDSIRSNNDHVRHAKEIVKEKNNTSTCYKCGAEMVLREAKKGKNKGNKFYGCSNFPKCRNTVEIA